MCNSVSVYCLLKYVSNLQKCIPTSRDFTLSFHALQLAKPKRFLMYKCAFMHYKRSRIFLFIMLIQIILFDCSFSTYRIIFCHEILIIESTGKTVKLTAKIICVIIVVQSVFNTLKLLMT